MASTHVVRFDLRRGNDNLQVRADAGVVGVEETPHKGRTSTLVEARLV